MVESEKLEKSMKRAISKIENGFEEYPPEGTKFETTKYLITFLYFMNGYYAWDTPETKYNVKVKETEENYSIIHYQKNTLGFDRSQGWTIILKGVEK